MSQTNTSYGDEEPPSVVPCKVCGGIIDLDTKKEQHVVKCEYCNEATPIRDPPPGQKYIRCPCNCLLICKSTAQRISCPRATCRKIIVLFNNEVQNTSNDFSPIPGMCCVNCGHCGETFLFNSLINQLARCPHCEKKSSVGRFARTRGSIFLVLAIISLTLAITLTVVFRTRVSGGSYGFILLYAIFYLIAIFLFTRSVYFLTMKNSLIVENQS